ncbi:hypothetical protein ACFW95_28650 [Streptomyces sp. NPDC059474]|uniref:hypothetical protein n=1 Tax=Streptomyces sp. NPDC059474 TaxID=3346846 RepID=UPI0036CFC682
MQEMQYRAPDGEHEGWLEPAEHKGWFGPGHRHAPQAKQGAVVTTTMPLPRSEPPVSHQGRPQPRSAPAHHTGVHTGATAVPAGRAAPEPR